MRKRIGILIMLLVFAATLSLAGSLEQARAADDPIQSSEDSDMRLPVQDQKGQEVGQVVALATTDDMVAYFLVAMNGSEGELTPIPFNAAQYDPQMNAVILLNADNSELHMAPTITPDQVQKLADPEFERQVHSYYGDEPAQQEENTSSQEEDNL